MNKVTRSGVFETNSSSTHSISFSDSPHFIKLHGPIEIHCGEFGWEEETYYDFNTKASYLLTDLASREDTEKLRTLNEVIKEETGQEPTYYGQYEDIIVNINNKNPWLIEYITHTYKNNDGTEGSWKESKQDLGYIDHQSIESGVPGEPFKNKKKLRQYLFDENTFLRTDNDNH